MSEITGAIVTIVTAIIGLAILAVLVQSQNTSQVISSAAQGLASDIQAATSVGGGGFAGAPPIPHFQIG